MIIFDTVIIGAGPAGVGAAIQAKHNGLNILVLEKKRIGGRIILAHKIENLIIGRAKRGEEVVNIFVEMLKKKGITVKMEEVRRLEGLREGLYKIYTDRNCYDSKTIVIATGLEPIIPEILGIKKVISEKKVFFEWMDLKYKLHSPVIIIGGGEVGFDSACSLKKSGFEVVLIMRSKNPDINPYLLKEVRRLSVTVIKGVNYDRLELKGNDVRLVYKKNEKVHSISGRSILITFGGRPSLRLLDRVENRDGIYICGDAKESNFHQTAIAFGDGVNTAMKITNYIRRNYVKCNLKTKS